MVMGRCVRRDDTKHVAQLVRQTSTFSRHVLPEPCCSFRPLLSRGRRESRVPIAPMGPEQWVESSGVRTTGVTGNNPAFPARWVTAYFVLSPARLGLFVTAFATRTAQCDETPATWASGPHDFTVRFRHASSLVTSASTASHRNTPDDAQRPSIG